MSIGINLRKAVHTRLKGYCFLSDENDFIEATEWTNGEGWDIILTTKQGSQHISLTHGAVRALLVLTNYEGE